MAEEKKLSTATLKKVFNRHYQLLGCFNYERQMSTGFAWTMMPALRNLYGDDPDKMQEAVKRHLEFFNCATTVSPFIIGITCAMEEQYANSAEGEYDPASITSVKTALMGPLAGIGDSFFSGHFSRYRCRHRRPAGDRRERAGPHPVSGHQCDPLRDRSSLGIQDRL